MRPIVLTNAFLRPRATRLSSGVTLSETSNVYACVEEMVGVIHDDVGASPLMLPTSFDRESLSELLDHVDGIMLPGAVSNIHPSHYGNKASEKPQTFDLKHDETDMFLVSEARKRGMPFFGICRSLQAMNIVFGGTLKEIDASGGIDHSCSNPCDGHIDAPQYMHEAVLEKNGVLASYFPSGTLSVNSMHEQAIDKLGEGLSVEARAPDGIIEAISWEAAQTFFVAVQWHPEAMPQHPVSQTLFKAFEGAVKKRCTQRRKNGLAA
jgi:putative glutamine amidotransferase